MIRQFKVINLVSSILVLLIVSLYLYFFTIFNLIQFIVWFVIAFAISRIKVIRSFDFIYRNNIIIISYLMISFVGLLITINYKILYGLTFGPYGDDSGYFSIIESLANGYLTFGTPTLYELVLAPWFVFIKLFNNEISNIDLLPINWLIASLVVTSSLILTRVVIQKEFNLTLPFFILIGNSIFLDSLLHLYRDGLALLLFLLALIFAVKKKYVFAIIITLACGGVRSGTGGIALFGVVLLYLTYKFQIKNLKKIMTFSLIILITIMFIDNQFHIGGNLRSLYKRGQQMTIIEVVKERADRLGGGISNNDKLTTFGIIGLPVIFVSTILAPIEILAPTQTIGVHIHRTPVFQSTGLYSRAILGWFTIFLWLFTGPPLLVGLWVSHRGTIIEKLFLFFFVIIVLSITFISFQARHRTTFFVLFPLFVALSEKYIPKNSSVLKLTQIAFILLIILTNLPNLF